jgi:hypothetical protein
MEEYLRVILLILTLLGIGIKVLWDYFVIKKNVDDLLKRDDKRQKQIEDILASINNIEKSIETIKEKEDMFFSLLDKMALKDSDSVFPVSVRMANSSDKKKKKINKSKKTEKN